MRFYKLLLVVPMIAFGFAMDANAQDCEPITNPGRQNKDQYLYLTDIEYQQEKAYVCGGKDASEPRLCANSTKILVTGKHYNNGSTPQNGPKVYLCDKHGGLANTLWIPTDDWGWIKRCGSFSNKPTSQFYEDSNKIYYCRSNRLKGSSGDGKACIASVNSDACYTCKLENVCTRGGGTWTEGATCDKGTCSCKKADSEWNDMAKKCVITRQACENRGGRYQADGTCTCDSGEYFNKAEQRCKSKNDCTENCGNITITLDNIGNTSTTVTGGGATIGDINQSQKQQQQQKQDSDNQYGNDVVANGSCTTASKGKTESVNCTEAAKIGLDTTGAIECMRECDGQDWLYFKKSCNEEAGYKCEARNVGSGLGCLKCTKGGKSAGGKTGGGSGGGSVSSCRATRTTPEGKACCAYPNSVARYNKDTKGCDCVDTTKEFKMLDGNVGACVAKTDSPAATTPCNCTAAVTVVNTVTSNTCAAASSLVQSSVTNVNMLCPNGQPSASCNSDTLNAYVTTINMAITDCNAQPVAPAKPTINERRLAAAVEAIDKYRSGLDVSVWKDEEGNFNTARLVSDSIAGVVLGTAGGLITSSIVKKNQVKSGFEDIMCTIGGQPVGSYGDEIQVGIQ